MISLIKSLLNASRRVIDGTVNASSNFLTIRPCAGFS